MLRCLARLHLRTRPRRGEPGHGAEGEDTRDCNGRHVTCGVTGKEMRVRGEFETGFRLGCGGFEGLERPGGCGGVEHVELRFESAQEEEGGDGRVERDSELWREMREQGW